VDVFSKTSNSLLVKRDFELCEESRYVGGSYTHTTHFSVMHWNVLADKFAVGDDLGFPYAEKKYLTWEYRLPLIKEELKRGDADIIGLAEVDRFSDFFEPYLKNLGYNGIYGRNVTGDESSEKRKDAVALFYKTSKFELQQHQLITLEGGQKSIIVNLKEKDGGKNNVFVVMSHLKAKVGFEDVRERQGKEILKGLSQFIADSKKRRTSKFNERY